MSIIQTRKQVESCEKSHTKRNNLSLGDKLRVLQLMNIHKNQAQVAFICKIHRKTIKNVLDSLENIHAAEISGTPIGAKCPLLAMCPAIDNAVIKFINFARSQRLPVTSSHIKSCAEQAAKRSKIQSFSASNGWLQKFYVGLQCSRHSSCMEKLGPPSLFLLLTE